MIIDLLITDTEKQNIIQQLTNAEKHGTPMVGVVLDDTPWLTQMSLYDIWILQHVSPDDYAVLGKSVDAGAIADLDSRWIWDPKTRTVICASPTNINPRHYFPVMSVLLRPLRVRSSLSMDGRERLAISAYHAQLQSGDSTDDPEITSCADPHVGGRLRWSTDRSPPQQPQRPAASLSERIMAANPRAHLRTARDKHRRATAQSLQDTLSKINQKKIQLEQSLSIWNSESEEARMFILADIEQLTGTALTKARELHIAAVVSDIKKLKSELAKLRSTVTVRSAASDVSGSDELINMWSRITYPLQTDIADGKSSARGQPRVVRLNKTAEPDAEADQNKWTIIIILVVFSLCVCAWGRPRDASWHNRRRHRRAVLTGIDNPNALPVLPPMPDLPMP